MSAGAKDRGPVQFPPFPRRAIFHATHLDCAGDLVDAGVVFAEDAKTVGVPPEEAREGFVSLFDGKTLSGWQGDVEHYAVKDGVMTCHGVNLFTAKEYANFILRFEFKLPPGGQQRRGHPLPLKGEPT